MPPTSETERRLALPGREVTYRLRRSARRTIGLSIDQRGLRVTAPQRASLSAIESLIREHGAWVVDKLDRWAARPAVPPLLAREGAVVFIAGQASTVKIDPQRRRGHHFDAGLRVLTLNGAQAPQDALRAALQAEARRCFGERLASLAPQLGVPVPPLRLSSARTRWGSCSACGTVALNWRLLLMPLPAIDYVVAHELAHLKEMNHSPRFWSVVSGLCPEWQQRRAELKVLGASLPEI